MGKFVFVFILMGLFFSGHVFAADDIVQITTEGTSQSQDPAQARADSLKEAINKGSMQVITGLIGEASVEKNAASIRSKVLPQSSKYVEFYKSSEPLKRGEQTITSVNLKISVGSLKEILTSAGLLFQSEGLATVLPMFRVIQKKDDEKIYRWWTEEVSPQNAFLREQAIIVIHQLDSVFRPQNFYLIDPVSNHYVQWVPEPFRSENPTSDDMNFFGAFFKAQMILQGDVSFEPSPATPGGIKIQIKFSAINVANGRIVGEVTRTFEGGSNDWSLGVSQLLKKSMPDVSHDLASQVNDEWTKGTFGASLLQLSIRGNMGYEDLESIKKQMLTKLGDVKSIRERRLERGESVFEVDAAGGLTNLAKRLQTTSFEGFKMVVERIEPDRVDLRWAKVGNN